LQYPQGQHCVSDAYVSVANLFLDQPIASFGDPSACKGALPELVSPKAQSFMNGEVSEYKARIVPRSSRRHRASWPRPVCHGRDNGDPSTTTPSADPAQAAALAVGALHLRGVVHRDLKPENLFLTGRGLKVVDFGVAALGRAAFRGGLTGTPLYMAPEQFTASDAVDPRSDIYALGVVLYQLLSGAPPFPSQHLGELAQMHCCCPPPPLRQRQPAVSPPLAAAVHRALAKRPADRFASMESLAAALLVEEPVGQVMSAA
jgi:serine/threonine protein kinase